MRSPRKILSSVIAAMSLVTFLGVTGVKTAEASSPTPWTPVPQNIYNKPKGVGTHTEQYAFADTFADAIRATPRGETIRVSTFSVSFAPIIRELMDAKARGVNVQFITWDYAYKHGRKLLDPLKRALGSNIKAASYVKICRGSCYNSGGTHHAKMLLISRVIDSHKRSVRDISFVTSANLSTGSVVKSWNNTQLIVGHPKIYDALRRYFDGMKYDRTKRDIKGASDGTYTLHFYPKTKPVNPFYTTLRQTTCNAGGGKSTVIRIMMYLWTYKMRDIATRLVQLKKQGCDVAVAVSNGPSDKRIFSILKKGHVDSYNARTHSRFVHAKMGLVRGKVNGKHAELVMTGSLNFTYQSMKQNTEIALFVNNSGTVNTALSMFKNIAAHSRHI